MKCTELQQRLDDYLDGNLDPILVSMLEKHTLACENCNLKVAQGRLVQSQLKQLFTADNQVSEEFISSAFDKVRRSYPERQHTNHRTGSSVSIGLKTGFASAIAAGFSLWVVLTTFILPTMESNEAPINLVTSSHVTEQASNISTLNLKIDETRIVRLAINTRDSFDKVTLSVVLPTHVELKGHKNTRQLSWDTTLAKGNNVLRIPLKAIKYGQGDFVARLTHNGKVKTFRLFLKSRKPDLSNINTIELQV